jgi:hypothetical protein
MGQFRTFERGYVLSFPIGGGIVMNLVQVAFSVVLALHGLIHLIGFLVPWRLATVDGFPYRSTVLNGSMEMGDVGVRALGVVWLLLAVGFVVAAFGVWRGESWALLLTAGLSVISLAVCIVGLPEASAGIAVNFVILGVSGYLAVTGRVALQV